MAKKSAKASYTSKGVHSTAKSGLLNSVRADRSKLDVALNVIDAYRAGRNPWVTIDNPNPKETAKRKVRIKANDLWGSPKENKSYSIPGTGEQNTKKKAAKNG